jgi:phosphoribosyl 1,2-cyclic phosphate phosphodiesterase
MGGDSQSHKGRVTILGCGGSGGVPLIGNYWGLCDPNESKNRRSRASIHLEINNVSIVIDTGPDFRGQINREKIEQVDCVLYTHTHSDHVNGIDDLRYASIISKEIIPIFGQAIDLADLENRYGYLFKMHNPLYQPRLTLRPYKESDYHTNVQHVFEKGQINETASFQAMPIPHHHGQHIHALSYRFGEFTYSTDVSDFSEQALDAIKGTKIWILDCGQYDQEFVEVHPNFDTVQKWNETVKAERVILTHLPVKADYQTLCDELPHGYEVAYDGLSLEIFV